MKELDKNSREILYSVLRKIQASDCISNLSIIDVGCGEGTLIKEIDKLDVKMIYGIGETENLPNNVNVIHDVDLSEKNWSKKLNNQLFDWVISTEVIEHLVNPFQFLYELRKIVKDKGKILLTFPNVHNLRSIIGYMLTGRFSGFFGNNFNNNHVLYDQHIFIPNHHLIKYLLKVNGFDIDFILPVNGKFKLTSQTTMVIASTCKPLL